MKGATASRPTIVFVTEVAPSKQSLNGFSQRVYHFLDALGQEANVHLALIRIGDRVRDLSDVDAPPQAGIETFHVREGRHASTLLGKARRATRYVLPSPPAGVYPLQLRAFDEFIRRLEPQAVVTHLPLMAGLGIGLPRHTKLISLLEEASERTLPTSLASHGRIHRALAIRTENRRMRSLYRRVGQRSALNVLISDEEQEYFRRLLPSDRTVVIPQGIDCSVFDPALLDSREPDYDVAVFGDLAYPRNWLGIRQVLQAAAESRTSARDWRWLLVGNVDGEVRSQLGGFPGVTITGFVEDIRPWYGLAKVTLVPTLPAAGVKTTVLQAWAMQRPVVATQAGVRGLPAEHGVNVLVGASTAGVVEAVGQALASAPLRDELGRAGRETVVTRRRIEEAGSQFREHCMRVLNN